MTASDRSGGRNQPVAVAPRHLHPLSPLVNAAFHLARAWPIVIIALARGAGLLLLAISIGLLVWRSLSWLRTTYEIGADGLVVRSGILWRTIQVVPPQRVQQVEVRRQLRHRALGLAVVRIGLAGAGGTSQVELDALSVDDAERLGARLERWRHQAGAEPDVVTLVPGSPLPPPAAGATPVEPPRPILRIGLGQLIIAGLTSRSLWLAPFAALAAAVQLVADAGIGAESTDAVAVGLSQAAPAVSIAVIMVFALLVASASTVFTHHDLTVYRSGDDLVVRRGLLEKRSVNVPQRRVQYVVMTDNIVRRWFGLSSIDARTADLGGGGDDASNSSTSIPIGGRADMERLVGEFLPGVVVMPSSRRHPAGAVRRSIVRRSVRVAPLAALVGLLVAGPSGAGSGAVIGLGVGVVTGWMAGRRLRSGWDDGVVVTESGVVAWRRSVVPVARIQSVGVVQSPFQRRLGLASVRLDVAGAIWGVELRDLSVADARLLARCLGMSTVPAWCGRDRDLDSR